MTFAEYAAIDAINASAIVAGRVSMRHMRAEMTGERSKDSPAMAWGQKVHAAVLEPDRFFRGLAIWDGAVKRGKDWDAFKADNPDPDMIVTRAELSDLEAMKRMIWEHVIAGAMLTSVETEQVISWEGFYGRGKARMDATRPGVVIDYKTTRNIEPAAFYRAAFNLAYHVRMGWYAHGVEIVTGKRPQVYLIVQESERPFDCWVCEIPPPVLKAGEKEAVEIAVRYSVALTEGRFWGVSNEVEEYLLPAWAGGGEDATPNMEGITNE